MNNSIYNQTQYWAYRGNTHKEKEKHTQKWGNYTHFWSNSGKYIQKFWDLAKIGKYNTEKKTRNKQKDI